MYLNVQLLTRALGLALFKSPFSARRWAYVLLFTGLYGVMWLIVAVGRALDHVFSPGFKRQDVQAPVFIVAPPRSGTTLTHRLLSLDEERFVHNKLYETIFPSLIWQRFLHALVRLDRRIGHPFARMIARAEKNWFVGWKDLHKLRFDQPEEDECLFIYNFVTESMFLLFLHVDELWEAGFQDALPPARQRKVLRFYRSCLQRQLYRNGPGKSVLSKITQSAGAAQSLLETFPDARFITIIRHPCQSVPSHVSLFWRFWQVHSPGLKKDSPVSQAYARLIARWFRHLFEFRQRVDPQRYYCIDYRNLVRDPAAALEKVYDHFGWTMSDAFRARLDAACRRERDYKSRHEYTLEEFGLTNEWLEQELGPVLDFYGLTAASAERPTSAPSPRPQHRSCTQTSDRSQHSSHV